VGEKQGATEKRNSGMTENNGRGRKREGEGNGKEREQRKLKGSKLKGSDPFVLQPNKVAILLFCFLHWAGA
jgi:hypothetical protein